MLRPGDLLCFHGRGFFSPLIRFWEHSEWSHVAIFGYQNGVPGYFESDSVKHGSVFTPLCVEQPDAWIELNVNWTQENQKFAESLEHLPYDWIDFIRCMFGLPARNRGYICSELAAAICRNDGAANFPEDFLPTPAGLIDFFVYSGHPLQRK